MKYLLPILLLFAAPAWGAVTFDPGAVATNSCAACSSVAATISVGGGCTDPILIAGTSWESSVTLTSVVATAGALTSRGNTTDGDANHSVNLSSRVGATGSQTVTATFSGSSGSAGIVVSSYCGVDGTTPHGTAATNSSNDTPVTVNVSSASGELVVDMIFSHATVTADGGQTQRANVVDGSGFARASSDEAGAGTVTMSWTQSAGHYWGSVAIPLKAAAGAPAGVARRRIVVIP